MSPQQTTRAAQAAILLCILTATATAGILDNRGGAMPGPGVTGILGGTFLADEANLASFTLELSNNGAADTLIPRVIETDRRGAPTNVVIWTGAPITLNMATEEFTFNPNVAVVPGNRYWVGVDGFAPGAVTGTYSLTVTGGPPPPTSIYGSGTALPAPTWVHDPFTDVASLIVTNPEPGTGALFLLGFVGVATARRRRRRQRRAAAKSA